MQALRLSSTQLQLELSSDRQELEPVRLAVLDFLTDQAPSPAAIFKLELVLEETLMNIVWHAFRDQDSHQVRLSVATEPGLIVLQFEDNGIEFNPLLAPEVTLPATLAEARPGGLGLMLVRKFSQSMAYERHDGRNRLTIKVAST